VEGKSDSIALRMPIALPAMRICILFRINAASLIPLTCTIPSEEARPPIFGILDTGIMNRAVWKLSPMATTVRLNFEPAVRVRSFPEREEPGRSSGRRR